MGNLGTGMVFLSCMACAFATTFTGPLLAVAAVNLATYPLALGLLERHIRRRARAGRLHPLDEPGGHLEVVNPPRALPDQGSSSKS